MGIEHNLDNFRQFNPDDITTYRFDQVEGYDPIFGRPMFLQPDGSKVSRRGITQERDGVFYEFPTVDPIGGRIMEPDEAFQVAMETGEYMAFTTQEEADTYSKMLSEYLSTGQDVFVKTPRPKTDEEILAEKRENLDEQTKANNQAFMNMLAMMDSPDEIRARIREEQMGFGGVNLRRAMIESAQLIDKNILAPAELFLNTVGAGETAKNLSDWRDTVNQEIAFDTWQGQRVEEWNDTGLWTTSVAAADFATFVAFFKARAALSVAGTFQISMEESEGDVELSLGRATSEALMYYLFHRAGTAMGKRLTPGMERIAGRGMASVEARFGVGLARGGGAAMPAGSLAEPYRIAAKALFRRGRPNVDAFRAVGRLVMQDLKTYGAAASRRYGPGLQTYAAASRAALAPVVRQAFQIVGVQVAYSVVDELITELHRDQIEAMNGVILDSYSDRVLARNSPGNLAHGFGFGLAMGAYGASRGLSRAYQSGKALQKAYFQRQLQLDAKLKAGKISSEEYFESTQLLAVQFRQFRNQTASSKILNEALLRADDAMVMQMAKNVAMAAKGPEAKGAGREILREHALRIGAELRRRGLIDKGSENISLAPPSPIIVEGKVSSVPSEPGTGARRPSAFGGSRRGMLNPALLGLGGRRLSPSDKEQGVSRYLDAQKAAGLKVPGFDVGSMVTDMPDTTLQMYGITREQYLESLRSAAGFDVTQLAPVADLPDNILTYAASQINEPIGANVIIPVKSFRSKVQGDFHNLGLIIPKGEFEDVYMVPARVQASRAQTTLNEINEAMGGNPVQRFRDLPSQGIDDAYNNLIIQDFFDTSSPGYGLEMRRVEEQFGLTFLDKTQSDVERLADAGDAGQRLQDELRDYIFLDKQGRIEYALDKARQIGATPMLGDVIGATFIDARSGRTARSKVALDMYSRGSGVRQNTSYDKPEGLIHDTANQVHGASYVLNTNTAVIGSEFTMYQGRARLTILSGKRGELQIHDMKPVTVTLEDFIPVDFVEGQSPLTLRPDEASDLVGNIMARADVETNPKFKRALEEYAAKVANLGYRPRGGGIEPPATIDQAIYYMTEGITIKEPYFETVDGKRVKKFRDRKIDAEYIRDNFHTIKPSQSTKSSVLRETQSAKKRTPQEQKQYDDLKRLLRAEAKGAKAAQVGMVPRTTMQEKVKAVKDKLKQDIADLKYDRDLGVEGQKHIVRYIKGQKDLPVSVREAIIGRVNVAGKLDIEDLTKLLDKAEVEIHTVIMNQEFRNLSAQLKLARKASTSNPTSGYALLPGNRKELETLLNLYGDQPITLDPVSNASRKRAEEIVANVDDPALVANAQIVLDTPTGSIGQFYPPKESLKDLGALESAHDTARQLREAIEAVLQVNNETQRALAEGRIKDRVEMSINTDIHVRAGNSSGALKGKQRIGREMVDNGEAGLFDRQNRADMLTLDQKLEAFTVNGLAYTEGFAQVYARDNEFNIVDTHNKRFMDNLLLDNGVSAELEQNYGEAFNKGKRVPDEFRETVTDGTTEVSLSSDELVFYAATLRSTRAVDLFGTGKFDIGPATPGGKPQTISINKEFVESVNAALDTLSAKTGFELRAIVDGVVDMFNNPESPLVKLTKRGLIQDHNRSFVQSENGTYMPFAYRTDGGAELLGPQDVIGFSEIQIKEQLEGSMLPATVFDGMESRAVLGAQQDSSRAIATTGAFFFYSRRAQAQAAQFSVNNALANLHKVFSDPMVVQAYADNGLSDAHSSILALIENIAKFRSGHGQRFRGDDKTGELVISRVGTATLGFNVAVATGQSASAEMYNLEGLEKPYYLNDKKEFLRNFQFTKSSSFRTFLSGLIELSKLGKDLTPGRLRTFLENHRMPTIREQIPESRLPVFDYLMQHSTQFNKRASNESGIQVFSGQTSVEMGSGSSLARILEDIAFAGIQGKDIQTVTAGGEAFVNQFMDRVQSMLSKLVLTPEGIQRGGPEEFKDVFGHDLTDAVLAEIRAHVADKLKIENPTRGELMEYVSNNRMEVAGLDSLKQVIISHFDRATTRSQPAFDMMYVNEFGQSVRNDVVRKYLYPFRGYLNTHASQIVMAGFQSRGAKLGEAFEIKRIQEWEKFIDAYVNKKREQHEKAQEGLDDKDKTPFDEKTTREEANESARMGDGPSQSNYRKYRRAFAKSYFTGMRYLIYYDIIKGLLSPADTARELVEIFEDPDKRRDWIVRKAAKYTLMPGLGTINAVFPYMGIANDFVVLGAREFGLPLGGFESQNLISAAVERVMRQAGSAFDAMTAEEFEFHKAGLELVMLGFEVSGLVFPGVAPTTGAARQLEKMIPDEESINQDSKSGGSRRRRRRSNPYGGGKSTKGL